MSIKHIWHIDENYDKAECIVQIPKTRLTNDVWIICTIRGILFYENSFLWKETPMTAIILLLLTFIVNYIMNSIFWSVICFLAAPFSPRLQMMPAGDLSALIFYLTLASILIPAVLASTNFMQQSLAWVKARDRQEEKNTNDCSIFFPMSAKKPVFRNMISHSVSSIPMRWMPLLWEHAISRWIAECYKHFPMRK